MDKEAVNQILRSSGPILIFSDSNDLGEDNVNQNIREVMSSTAESGRESVLFVLFNHTSGAGDQLRSFIQVHNDTHPQLEQKIHEGSVSIIDVPESAENLLSFYRNLTFSEAFLERFIAFKIQ